MKAAYSPKMLVHSQKIKQLNKPEDYNLNSVTYLQLQTIVRM
jgi:hypothetical protein